MLPKFSLFTTLACAVASALPTEPAPRPVDESLSVLGKREASCSSNGQNYNFDRSELQSFYNSLVANPGQSRSIGPNYISFVYYGKYLKVSVQNKYLFQTQDFTNQQLAHALSFIFCCDNSGHCSDGRAVFPSGEGNLVVHTCNVGDKCHDN